MFVKYVPIAGRTAEIVDNILSSPEVPVENDEFCFKLRLCVEEAVENIVSYAYGPEDGFIEVKTDLADGVFTVRLKDAGIQFNPLEKPDPNINLSAEDRPIGGLGIFLCKQMMDSVTYAYENGCNILTLTKKVN